MLSLQTSTFEIRQRELTVHKKNLFIREIFRVYDHIIKNWPLKLIPGYNILCSWEVEIPLINEMAICKDGLGDTKTAYPKISRNPISVTITQNWQLSSRERWTDATKYIISLLRGR